MTANTIIDKATVIHLAIYPSAGVMADIALLESIHVGRMFTARGHAIMTG